MHTGGIDAICGNRGAGYRTKLSEPNSVKITLLAVTGIIITFYKLMI